MTGAGLGLSGQQRYHNTNEQEIAEINSLLTIDSLQAAQLPEVRVLFKTNDMVDDYNKEYLHAHFGEENCKEIELEIIYLNEFEGIEEVLQEKSITDLGGLPKTAILAVGSRIMISRNVDIKKGILNGSQGVVKTLTEEFIGIEFDETSINNGLIYHLEKSQVNENIAGLGWVIMRQFPVRIPYASTLTYRNL